MTHDEAMNLFLKRISNYTNFKNSAIGNYQFDIEYFTGEILPVKEACTIMVTKIKTEFAFMVKRMNKPSVYCSVVLFNKKTSKYFNIFNQTEQIIHIGTTQQLEIKDPTIEHELPAITHLESLNAMFLECKDPNEDLVFKVSFTFFTNKND